jgi:hypothetical protein
LIQEFVEGVSTFLLPRNEEGRKAIFVNHGIYM